LRKVNSFYTFSYLVLILIFDLLSVTYLGIGKMPKPMFVTDILRQQTPRKSYVSNRFAALARDPSPAPDGFRPRANSVKRKLPEGPSFADVAAAKKICSVTINDGVVTELETEIATVNSVCDKVAEDITAANADPAAILIFNGILEALRGISKIQAKIVGNMNKSVETVVSTENDFTVVGGARRKTSTAPAESALPAARQTTVSSDSLGRVAPPSGSEVLG
jgi:hypothetical protein